MDFPPEVSFLTPSFLRGLACGSPPVLAAGLAAEAQGQEGSGEQEAEQSQGSQQDAKAGTKADDQPLTPAAARGEDGEGEAAADRGRGAVMVRREAAPSGGLVHPQSCCYLHLGPSGRCWHWPPCWQ